MTMAIINDNDMEIILKGNQEETIRKMLKDRLFCLIKMPAKKTETAQFFCITALMQFPGTTKESFLKTMVVLAKCGNALIILNLMAKTLF